MITHSTKPVNWLTVPLSNVLMLRTILSSLAFGFVTCFTLSESERLGREGGNGLLAGVVAPFGPVFLRRFLRLNLRGSLSPVNTGTVSLSHLLLSALCVREGKHMLLWSTTDHRIV